MPDVKKSPGVLQLQTQFNSRCAAISCTFSILSPGSLSTVQEAILPSREVVKKFVDEILIKPVKFFLWGFASKIFSSVIGIYTFDLFSGF